MIVVGTGVEHNLDRHALHDFHIVARSILRRQQAEACAAGASDAVDLAVVLASIGIDLNGDALARLHVAQLGFLEVGGNPDVIEIDHFHQFLPRNDVLPDLDRAVADDPVHRSDHFRVVEIEFRLFEAGFGTLNLSLRGLRLGLGNLQLLGGGVGLTKVGFRLNQPSLGLGNLVIGGIGRSAGSIDRSRAGLSGCCGLIELLL